MAKFGDENLQWSTGVLKPICRGLFLRAFCHFLFDSAFKQEKLVYLTEILENTYATVFHIGLLINVKKNLVFWIHLKIIFLFQFLEVLLYQGGYI